MTSHVGRGDGARPVRRPFQLRLSQSAATLALAAVFLPTALGHEGHHMDKIPEGEAISLDPIVCCLRQYWDSVVGLWLTCTGHDAMGTHLCADACLWHSLPRWDGSRGKFEDRLVEGLPRADCRYLLDREKPVARPGANF